MAKSQLKQTLHPAPRFRIPGLPVLLYHKLTDAIVAERGSRDWEYDLLASNFETHLRCIRESGVRILSVREMLEPPASEGEELAAGITFDDGFASDYEKAFPLLVSQGARADFFVATATIGKAGYLSWEQMREMQKARMSFHSHGHSHVALSQLGQAALERELATSRGILEDRLGCAVDFLAAPYGLLNQRVIRAALRLGYRGICNSQQWTTRMGSRCINRIAVRPHTSIDEFRRLLFRHPVPYLLRSSRSLIIYLPKQVLLRTCPAQLGVRVLEEHG